MALGPRALGHEPLVLGEQRENVVKAVESTGVITFRDTDNPIFPWLPDK